MPATVSGAGASGAGPRRSDAASSVHGGHQALAQLRRRLDLLHRLGEDRDRRPVLLGQLGRALLAAVQVLRDDALLAPVEPADGVGSEVLLARVPAHS